MNERSFGLRVFHSENEMRAERLNKQELCRYNTLQSVLQKEKTLYEKHFKQRYELFLRSHTFRRISDFQVLKERGTSSPGRRPQRRFSEGTVPSRFAIRSLTARTRPMSYNGAASRNIYSSGGECTLCEHIANKIHSFKSEENISFLKVSRSASAFNSDHELQISRNVKEENVHKQFNNDCKEEFKFSENSKERIPSVASQVRTDASTNDAYIRNGRSTKLVEDHTLQKAHPTSVSFTGGTSLETETETDDKHTELSNHVEQDLTPSFNELNIESSDLLCGAEQPTLCHGQEQQGLQMKINRFMKIQDEFNKRNPLSREISIHSEISRFKSSTCERKKKPERKHYGPKDAIINEVLTTLGLNEDLTECESLFPIIS